MDKTENEPDRQGAPSPQEARCRPILPRLASVAGRRRKAAPKGGQRVRTRVCPWCGRRIRRRPGTRGPLPRSCQACAARLYVRRRLRAYLRSSRKYALRLHRWDLAGEIGGIIRLLDGEKAP